jgi:hypothetical protein
VSTTCYQVVCDRHTPRVVLADVWHDPECEASEHFDGEIRRWDKHNSGDQPIADTYGRPLPRQFRPHMPRYSSRSITVMPHEHMFIPDVVDRDQPDVITADDWARFLSDRVEGKPAPRDGFVRTTSCWVGGDEDTDGHKITIACELCKKLRGKPLRMPPTSADTLTMVLDRIGPTLPTEKQPLYDLSSGKLMEDTVVRVITVSELRKELGKNPRG